MRRFFCFRTVDPLGSLYDPNMSFCVLGCVFVFDECFWFCLSAALGTFNVAKATLDFVKCDFLGMDSGF